MEHEEKNYFGLKFWIITILFFPISLIYVVIKLVKYQNITSNKQMYYSELCKKQRRENNKFDELVEKKAEEKALLKLIEMLENKNNKKQEEENSK